MNTVKLADIAAIIRPARFALKTKEGGTGNRYVDHHGKLVDVPTAYPVADQPDDIKTYITTDDVLLHFNSGTLSVCSPIVWLDPCACSSAATLIIRPNKDRVLPEYLHRYLEVLLCADVHASKSVSDDAGIDLSLLAAYNLPLPAIHEQEKIIDICRKAYEHVILRHAEYVRTKAHYEDRQRAMLVEGAADE